MQAPIAMLFALAGLAATCATDRALYALAGFYALGVGFHVALRAMAGTTEE